MPVARRRGGRDPAAGATAHVDPMSYPDKTDMGPTEAHRALGRDRHSFMFEQVRVGLMSRACVCTCTRGRVRACVRSRVRVCVTGKDGRANMCARLFAWACLCARFALHVRLFEEGFGTGEKRVGREELVLDFCSNCGHAFTASH